MVDINLIKKLRDESQAPLKDVKEALESANGDLDQARKYLREKGLSKAAKKADRETNEGVVKIVQYDNKIVGIKLGCETDFVAKNQMFIDLGKKLLDIFSKSTDVANLSQVSENILNEVNSTITEGIATIGENIRILDAFVRTIDGKVFIYSHPGDKLSTVIFYNSNQDRSDVAKEIALQITAMNPTYKSVDQIPIDVLDSMKAEFRDQMANSGKPADIVENIIRGKMSKRFEEFVLTEQIFIKDETKRIKDIIPTDFVLVDYIRFSI